ncbi:hypothetical protein HK096_003636 [Nowakowskiella sp. JEL0078]|nr:hypothetical protein HK096_003636 [Nowakowskiella sp. JEL0078]
MQPDLRVNWFRMSGGMRQSKKDLDCMLLEISRFACWCVVAGVSCLSVFDEEGVVKKHAKEFETILRRTENVFYENEGDTFEDPTQIYISYNRRHANSTQNEKLSKGEDGILDIVNTVKNITTQSLQSDKYDDKISIGDFNEALGKFHLICLSQIEPQIIYVFGGTPDSLKICGFNPWAIRLSEFCSVPGDGRIRYGGFLKGLFQYAYAHFRFGA